MTDLADELKDRPTPDAWTLAWWRSQFQEVLKGYRGATHGINRLLAEYEDLAKTVAAQRELIQSLYRDAENDREKIGELYSKIIADEEEIALLKTRVDRIADFLNKQKGAKP